jgi:hypothetical protein
MRAAGSGKSFFPILAFVYQFNGATFVIGKRWAAQIFNHCRLMAGEE